MKLLVRTCLVAFALAVVSACASQKAPAEAAIASAQSSFDAVKSAAQQYVPDQAKSIQDGLTAARDAATKGDYAAALQQAQALPAKIADLSKAVAAKKTELTTAWTSMSAGVPQLVGALKSRVDILSASKRLPAGLTKATVDGAKTGLAAATQTWSEATAAAQSGDMKAAVAKGTDVKTKVVDLMKSLNMQVPSGAS